MLDLIRSYPSPLLTSSIAYLLERLGRYRETFDLLLKSMHEWQTIEQLYPMALDCIHFCQRTAVKLKDKHEREQLWLRFLDEILLISSSKSFDFEQLGDFRRIYGEILNSMIGYVTLPAILERIMRTDAADITKRTRRTSENSNRSTFEIRQLIQSMLENCSFELRLLETTRRLLQRDLNDDIAQMCTIINSSVPIRLNQCTYCQKSLNQAQEETDRKQQKSRFIVFACRHVYHLRCLIEIQTEQSNNNFCPQCRTSASSATPTPTTTVTAAPTTAVVARRLTTMQSDEHDRRRALNTTQQQVIAAMLDRKRLTIRQLNADKHKENVSTWMSPNSSSASLPLPEKWREYLSSSQ